MTDLEFKKIVERDGARLFRDMPWREPLPDGSYDPYNILVSEVMLQQTQVARVIPKYLAFLATFPDVQRLARASLADVLKLWNGLGYNRRAKYLHETVQHLAAQALPWTYEMLISCKGIGPNTAKAVLVYAYDSPEVFIETNIRTVFIHYFFGAQSSVTDAEILAVQSRTLNQQNPRAWYWALMDIGAYIKANTGNATVKSASYKKQSKFEGSLRQLRGLVLRELAIGPKSSAYFKETDTNRLQTVLQTLQSERLIHKHAKKYFLGSE